ncbi:LCP family protein [Kitasatospora sp. NPDC048540]|uniref:LCP family protein n=1 Tax=unclassified Kitasatospora TaxID=2633591 RepID=UPI0011EA6994|nr:LCP family protein [Kitasatospora sp. MBT63]
MAGQRAGASGQDADWWRDDAPDHGGGDYRHDAPHRDDAPPAGGASVVGQRRRRPDQAPAEAARTGGRAEARRAQQGRGGNGGSGHGGPGGSGGPAGQAGGGRAAARARKKPRNKKKIIIWTAVGAISLVAAAGGAVYLKLNGNIQFFSNDALSSDRPAAAAPDAQGRTPINVLLIGSDSRDGANRDLGGGEDGGARSDTTMLLHVYADHKHAVGVSFPRDALVDIPPCKLPNGKWTKQQSGVMFNSAFSVGNTDQGNPACTQNTVEKLTGIRVDHTIVINFSGFAAMTSAVGGVNVCLPNAIYEGDLNPNLGHKGKQLYPKGEQKVEGQAALDYVRLRHGIGDGSDIGRMKRQQAFMSSLIKQVKGAGMDPTTLLPLADAATKSLLVDEGLNSAAKLMSFALTMKDIDLHNIKFLTTPWKFDKERVALVYPDVNQLWAALKADRTLDGQDASGGTAAPADSSPAAPTPAADPGTAAPATVKGAGIKVAVYNGTTTPGLTTKASATLKTSKFTVTGTGNAAQQNHDTTVVQYGPGEKAGAQTVASLFPGATLEASSKSGISLVLGKDYASANGGAAGAGTPAAPGPLPSSVAQDARSADDDPCSNVSFG